VVAALLDLRERLIARSAGAAHDDDDVFDRRAFLHRLVGVPLERDGLSPAITAV
jgi:hypothetical protein